LYLIIIIVLCKEAAKEVEPVERFTTIQDINKIS